MPQTITLGILAPFLGGGYLGELMAQIHRSAQTHGVRVIAVRTGSKGRYNLPIALEHVDGWIVVLNSIAPDFVTQLLATGKPIVSIAHDFGDSRITSVESNNEHSTAQAASELIRVGHRYIAYMGNLAEYNVRRRLDGYHRALVEHGLPYSIDYIFDTEDSGHVGGVRVAREILNRKIPVTAVLAGTDRNAVGAITCFQEAGIRVPEDIAVIGYDNSFAARNCVPPLASIDQNLDQLAERAVSVALEQIRSGQRRGGKELVTNLFIPRQSCGLLPQADALKHSDTAREIMTDGELTTTVGISYEISRDLISASFERIQSLMRVLVPFVEWTCIGRWDDPTADPDKLTIRYTYNYSDAGADEREIGSNLSTFPPLAAMGKADSFDEQHFICVLPVLIDNKRLGVIAVSGLIGSGETSRYAGIMHYLELLAPAFARSALDEELAAYQAGLEELVNQRTAELVVAKERAELANRTRSVLLADMKRLATIGQEITTTLDTETVLKALYHRVGALLDAPSLSIWLIEGHELELRFGVEDGRPLPRLRIPLDSQTSHAARSARERREILAEFAPGHEDPAAIHSGALTMHTALFAPLIAGGEVLGVLLVQSAEEKAYGERERQIVRTLSAYGAVALANAAHAQQLAAATAELEHEKMRNVLVHAGKMVAVGRLASGVVHEMSHPVGTISLLTDNVEKLLQQGRTIEATEVMPDIAHEIIRLRNLIRRLRNFSRSDPPRIATHNLRSVFDDARRLFWPRVKMEQIDYQEEIDGIAIRADPERLSLVIANIIFNAVDAMANSPSKMIAISSSVGKEVVWLSIRDSGPGLSPEAMRHLFEPFFTSKPEGQGLGLGLALSAESLASMNARIEARNHPAGGAEFCLALQLCSEPASKDDQSEESVTAKPQHPGDSAQIAA